MFPWQRIEFWWVKTFNGESDSSGITDSCSGSGRPHKLKISHWYSDQCLYTPSRLHLLSKTSWTCVCLRNFILTHIHLMKCLSSMVNLIAVTTLLLMSSLRRCKQRMFKKNTNYFYDVRVSISLAILSNIFIQIGSFF